jgi:hypothetical protein
VVLDGPRLPWFGFFSPFLKLPAFANVSSR